MLKVAYNKFQEIPLYSWVMVSEKDGVVARGLIQVCPEWEKARVARGTKMRVLCSDPKLCPYLVLLHSL